MIASVEADRERVAALRGCRGRGDRARRRARRAASPTALDALGAAGLTSLLVEGGAELAGSLLATAQVDQLRVFVAPILLGCGRPAGARPRG